MKHLSEEDRLTKALHDNLDEQIRLQKELAATIAGEVMAYKVGDAAKTMGVSRQTIWKLVQQGKLVQVDELITRQSMSDYLNATPQSRRKAATAK